MQPSTAMALLSLQSHSMREGLSTLHFTESETEAQRFPVVCRNSPGDVTGGSSEVRPLLLAPPRHPRALQPAQLLLLLLLLQVWKALSPEQGKLWGPRGALLDPLNEGSPSPTPGPPQLTCGEARIRSWKNGNCFSTAAGATASVDLSKSGEKLVSSSLLSRWEEAMCSW